MEQFIAYENRGAGKNVYPWLVNLQHPVVDALNHALVIPATSLQLLNAIPPAKICPLVNIDGQRCAVMTHMMAGIPAKELGRPVANLRASAQAS
jgi:toxin CcdB